MPVGLPPPAAVRPTGSDGDAFRVAVRGAAEAASDSHFWLFGIAPPDRTVTSYGYIRIGAPLAETGRGRRVAAQGSRDPARVGRALAASDARRIDRGAGGRRQPSEPVPLGEGAAAEESACAPRAPADLVVGAG